MDGCTRMQAIFRIIMPLAAPGIAATAIFSIIMCWNEFLFALILTGNNAKTASVAIYNFCNLQRGSLGKSHSSSNSNYSVYDSFCLACAAQLGAWPSHGSYKIESSQIDMSF